MTNDEGGSITPENRIKQLEERLVEELSLIHISEPTRQAEARMPSSA